MKCLTPSITKSYLCWNNLSGTLDQAQEVVDKVISLARSQLFKELFPQLEADAVYANCSPEYFIDDKHFMIFSN